MHIRIRDPQLNESWTDVTTWFKSYVELGIRLSKLAKSQSFTLSKILLMVPKREYVTAAIALGFSIEKWLSNEEIGQEIEPEQLLQMDTGDIVRLKWKGVVWDIEFQSAEEKPVRDSKPDIEVQGRIDGALTSRNLRSVANVYKMPSGFPEGKHDVLTVTRGASLVVRSRSSDLHSKNIDQLKWETQASPALAIFGDVGHFQEQLQSQIEYPVLENIFQTDRLTIGEVTRIDYLSDDKFAHFVNLFEQVANFPKQGSKNYKKVELCDWVLLDGNNATARLAPKELLLDKRVISIVEVGVPRSQGIALDAFMSSLNDFRPVDAELQITWNPPPGAFIWGWSK